MGFLIRKYGVFAVAGLFFCCVMFAYADPSSADTGKKSLFSGSESLYGNRFDTGVPGDIFRRMIIAVLIVVVLGTAVLYASKKILPKLSHTQGKKIKVIETIHLGSRKTVHLLEVAGQQILVGSTHDRITKLADIFSEKGFSLDPRGNIDNGEGTE